MERELSITVKCDGKNVIAEIFDSLSGDKVTIKEGYEPEERNPVWRERVSDEIYSWVGLGMEE